MDMQWQIRIERWKIQAEQWKNQGGAALERTFGWVGERPWMLAVLAIGGVGLLGGGVTGLFVADVNTESPSASGAALMVGSAILAAVLLYYQLSSPERRE